MAGIPEKNIVHDVLVIGGGLAGLQAALRLSGKSDVAVFSKIPAIRSQSVMAQGGVNAVMNKSDTVEKHIKDTIEAGDFLNDADAVEVLCKESVHAVLKLDRLGALFSRREDGTLATRNFGAQSEARTCHSADRTGLTMMNTLYEQCLRNKIKFYEEWYILSLVMKDHRCKGAIALDINTGHIKAFEAKAVLICTGGYGRVYKTTATAGATTGDGIAMAFRQGVPIEDPEFVQFHPTGLYPSGILVSEAARAEGGYLLNKAKKRFMQKYAKKSKELAARDIVSRAIQTEIDKQRKEKFVYLDLRHLGRSKIVEKLPQIHEILQNLEGIDCTKELISVAPTAHYTMGGIPSNIDCEVLADVKGKKMDGLYAAGECACMSLHGANRVGGNSLADTLVFGRRAADSILKFISKAKRQDIEEKEVNDVRLSVRELIDNSGKEKISAIRGELQQTMQDNCGINRRAVGLKKAAAKIKSLKKRYEKINIRDKSMIYNTALIEALQLRNILDISEAIVVAALARKESRGAHHRTDHKKRNDKTWLKHSFVSNTEKGLKLDYKKVHIGKYKPNKRKY